MIILYPLTTIYDIKNSISICYLLFLCFQEVSSNEKNYRHDRLRHGVCVPLSCPSPSTNITRFKTNHKVLQEELSKCYTKKYSEIGLKSIVTHMHCQTQEPVYEIDTYDILVA